MKLMYRCPWNELRETVHKEKINEKRERERDREGAQTIHVALSHDDLEISSNSQCPDKLANVDDFCLQNNREMLRNFNVFVIVLLMILE